MWPVFKRQSIASTSEAVHELLAQGERPPFAITAPTQTAGRGRLGRTWQSPIGNLYLSFALPPKDYRTENLPLMPMHIGHLIASWVQKEFGIRLTQKWPNDLLFAGAKLGGILCESAVQTNGEINKVVVGIGLNLNTAPDHPDLEQKAVALAEILQTSIDQESCAQNLINYLSEHLTQDDAAKAFDFTLEAGQPWQHLKDEGIIASATIKPSGELVLERNGEPLTLNSAQHEYRWLYQRGVKKPLPPLWVADVGNSRTKIALFEPADAKEPTSIDVWEKAKPNSAVFERIQSSRVPYLFIASVNEAADKELAALCKLNDIAPVRVAKRTVRLHHSSYQLQQMGIDRLAAIEGYLSLSDQPVVIVSLGTATTIDCIAKNRTHAGGFIIPGLQTALTSLNEMTHALPKLIYATPITSDLGVDTQSAMIQGVESMTVQLIEHLRQTYSKVILTGGFAEILAQKYSYHCDPSLTLKGLQSMALGGTSL